MLTHGAVQSNHVRQTAAAAAFTGLACEAILEERVPDAPAAWAQEDAITDTVRHIGVAVDSRCSGLTVLAVAIPQSDGSATWQVGSPGRSCT